jgi:hypothetical protein
VGRRITGTGRNGQRGWKELAKHGGIMHVALKGKSSYRKYSGGDEEPMITLICIIAFTTAWLNNLVFNGY